MTEFEGRVLADLSVLKIQMKQVLGDSQPGRLTQIEARMQAHEGTLQRMKGMIGAFGALLTGLHFAIEYIAGRR